VLAPAIRVHTGRKRNIGTALWAMMSGTIFQELGARRRILVRVQDSSRSSRIDSNRPAGVKRGAPACVVSLMTCAPASGWSIADWRKNRKQKQKTEIGGVPRYLLMVSGRWRYSLFVIRRS